MLLTPRCPATALCVICCKAGSCCSHLMRRAASFRSASQAASSPPAQQPGRQCSTGALSVSQRAPWAGRQAGIAVGKRASEPVQCPPSTLECIHAGRQVRSHLSVRGSGILIGRLWLLRSPGPCEQVADTLTCGLLLLLLLQGSHSPECAREGAVEVVVLPSEREGAKCQPHAFRVVGGSGGGEAGRGFHWLGGDWGGGGC